MFQVLFVCTANQCRSPMAAALAQDAFDKRDLDVKVRSAGVSAGGFPSTAEAQQVMQERGLNLSKHMSVNVAEVLDPAPDLILAMEPRHLREIDGQAFTLKGFLRLAREAGPRADEESVDRYIRRVHNPGKSSQRSDAIRDPIGLGIAEYRRCAAELEAAIGELADLVWPSSV